MLGKEAPSQGEDTLKCQPVSFFAVTIIHLKSCAQEATPLDNVFYIADTRILKDFQ